ncbi:MAG: CBS domain-containing protein [Kiloniellales bacterium]|nr:CBS domain-containing protein [Kiloniellales bacterium]
MSEDSYLKVRDVMTPSPHMIDGLASVTHAMDVMKRHQVSSLVIDRRHDGDEYGILVVQDIAAKVIGEDRSPDRTSVYQIMSKPVIVMDADMNIKYAIRLLVRFGLSRGLVLEHGKVVGIVTMRDMVYRYIPMDAGDDS